MKKGVILQVRDFEILALVYGHTVTSFEKLKSKIFAGVNLQTASNRLNRLCQGGYLRKFRAGLVIYQGEPRQVQIVFTITVQGIQVLKCVRPMTVIRDEPVPLNSHTLIHDLLLGDVMDHLKAENPELKIVNTKLLGQEPARGIQVPDAILYGADGTKETAVELELTVKSERRYREIVTNYRLASRFNRVLFVYSDDSVVTKMAAAVGVEQPEMRDGPILFSKFEFRKLNEFLEKGEKPDAEMGKPTAA